MSRRELFTIPWGKRKEVSVYTGYDEDSKTRYVHIEKKELDNNVVEETPVSYSTQPKEDVTETHGFDDILILYVTADSSVAQKIIDRKMLSPEMTNELYINTMKMWYGSKADYEDSFVKKEFDRAETTDDFAKAYDYYVMRFSIKNTYKGVKLGDNSERADFFINVCQEMPKLEQISKRLCFDDSFITDAYDK